MMDRKENENVASFPRESNLCKGSAGLYTCRCTLNINRFEPRRTMRSGNNKHFMFIIWFDQPHLFNIANMFDHAQNMVG